MELAALQGSGPGGRIVKADVEEAWVGARRRGGSRCAPRRRPAAPSRPRRAAPETAKGEVETVELTKLQQTVARRMAESKATAPHFYLQSRSTWAARVEARAAIKAAAAEGDVVPSFNDMVVKACAIALREFPRANGAYRDGRLELYSRVNVGIAVAAEERWSCRRSSTPTARACARSPPRRGRSPRKVRDGTITPPELSGGTFTVSNLGMFGISNFHAGDQLAAGGDPRGRRDPRAPVVRDGEIITAQLMGVTLACDHRILYGADGAEFLARVAGAARGAAGVGALGCGRGPGRGPRGGRDRARLHGHVGVLRRRRRGGGDRDDPARARPRGDMFDTADMYGAGANETPGRARDRRPARRRS